MNNTSLHIIFLLQKKRLELLTAELNLIWEMKAGLKVKVKSLSRVRLFATPWTIAYQAPLSMGFSRQ